MSTGTALLMPPQTTSYPSRLAVEHREALRRLLPDTACLFDEPMAGHTSFRIGGPADALLLPYTVDDLRRIVAYAADHEVPLTVVGNGSNLLVRDGGLRGIVLKVAENLARIEVDGTCMEAQGGALLKTVSQAAGERALSGLEFAIGIPGTLGGAVIMNAGAYGGEMKDVVTRVRAVDEVGELRELTPEDLCFNYRSSTLQGRRWVVADAAMQLVPGDPAAVREKMADLTYQRESKQPLDMASAGSVFKRPPGKYVGPMIEQLGLKGFRIGGAQISRKHAGFIVNAGGATARDVLELVATVREKVQAEFDVWLETEVKVIGEEL